MTSIENMSDIMKITISMIMLLNC